MKPFSFKDCKKEISPRGVNSFLWKVFNNSLNVVAVLPVCLHSILYRFPTQSNALKVLTKSNQIDHNTIIINHKFNQIPKNRFRKATHQLDYHHSNICIQNNSLSCKQDMRNDYPLIDKRISEMEIPAISSIPSNFAKLQNYNGRKRYRNSIFHVAKANSVMCVFTA